MSNIYSTPYNFSNSVLIYLRLVLFFIIVTGHNKALIMVIIIDPENDSTKLFLL